MKTFLRALAPALVLIFGLSSAVGASDSSATRVITSERIARGELKNGIYHGLQFVKDPITLANGRWQGQPYAPGGTARPLLTFIRDFHISAELDVDNQPEAIVLLSENNGGSGSLTSLVVVKRQNEGTERGSSMPQGHCSAIASKSRTLKFEPGESA